MPEVGRLTLIDQDRYESRNLRNQAIEPFAVRRKKAQYQAGLARRLSARIDVTAIAESVERVPLGELRCDLLLGCLDSRRSRQFLNEAALRLGIPWLDAGVQSDGHLARLDRFAPGPDAPCFECGWSDADYAAVEQTYPCGDSAIALPTGAPSQLGALAAALQAIECQKILAGNPHLEPLHAGEQLVVGAGHHSHYRTAHRRNPNCRLGAHEPWMIEPLRVDLRKITIAEFVDRTTDHYHLPVEPTLSVFAKTFVTELICSGCAMSTATLTLSGSLSEADIACPGCGQPMAVTGFGLTEQLVLAQLSPTARDAPLGRLGFRTGEVITLTAGPTEIHVELRQVAPVAASAGAFTESA
jgi:molybdopterin/thiamine biosynthesis adenylyltransferase